MLFITVVTLGCHGRPEPVHPGHMKHFGCCSKTIHIREVQGKFISCFNICTDIATPDLSC